MSLPTTRIALDVKPIWTLLLSAVRYDDWRAWWTTTFMTVWVHSPGLISTLRLGPREISQREHWWLSPPGLIRLQACRRPARAGSLKSGEDWQRLSQFPHRFPKPTQLRPCAI